MTPLALALLLAATGAGAADGPGALVIVGGALDAENAAVYRRILELRLPERPVCVVPLASSVPEQSVREVTADLLRFGGPAAAWPVAALSFDNPDAARDARLAETLRGCGGFYFTGGDQSRIVDALRPGGGSTPVLEAVLEVWRRGGVVAGSSAGAAMMTDPMIGAGEPGEALAHGVVDRDGGPGVWVRDGMAFLPGAITDQHFLARGRLGRLLVVLAERPSIPVGLGVDENTAAVVQDGAVEVIGPGEIVIVDARHASRETPGFRGALLYLLGRGDRFDLVTAEASAAAGKQPVAQKARRTRVPDDPWTGDALPRFLAAFVRSTEPAAALPAGRFSLRLSRGPGFSALSLPGSGRYRLPDGLFAGPYAVDLLPRSGSPGPQP